MLEVKSKRTNSISEDEYQSLVALFENAFERAITVDSLKSLYSNNQLGYSLHNFLYEDGTLIGHNAGMPVYFFIGGSRVLAVNNISLMISKQSRGLAGFTKLMKESYAFYTKEDVQFLFSLPNDNSYPLLTKLKFMSDVEPLNVYCLPFRISGLKRVSRFVDCFSILFSKTWVVINNLLSNEKEVSCLIHKDLDGFSDTRYKRASDYKRVCLNNGCYFVYRIQEYMGIRAAFLVDVESKSESNFCKAISYILHSDSNNFDIILYVGHLPFKIHGMIRVPHTLEPKHFRLVYHIFDDNIKKEVVEDIRNWDINLSDDDVI